MGGMAVGNTPSIEASSLADILAIADRPPLKPSARRGHGHSLTLYIARVPGSRDIFLTTLKPRDKVVSAHDVESSLYYCHLETEIDDHLRLDDELSDNSQLVPEAHDDDFPSSSPDESVSPRQLPVNEPAAGVDPLLHSAPALPPRPQEPSPAIRRKPVAPAHATELFLDAPVVPIHASVPALPLRPTGPRPLNARRLSDNAVRSIPTLSTQLTSHPQELEAPPELPQRPQSLQSNGSSVLNGQRRSLQASQVPSGSVGVDPRLWNSRQTQVTSHPRTANSFEDMPWAQGQQPPVPPISPRSTASSLSRSSSVVSNIPAGLRNQQNSRGFNVIIIRRDPSTGQQSNVGKVTVPPLTSRYGRPGKALLQIFNPGYEKFRAAKYPSTAELVRCISEDDHCTYSTDLRLATRRQSIKSSSTPYFGDVPVNQLIAVTPSQPYSFLSPWSRVCEFFTGVTGRSLKCRHMLGRGTIYDEDPNSMSTVSLSELRFNTPTTKLFTKIGNSNRRPSITQSRSTGSVPRKPLTPTSPGPMAGPGPSAPPRYSQDTSSSSSMFAGRSGHHSHQGQMGPEDNDDRDHDWDIEPMDLSLGQERAGGGFKGNKAKLGKLIVEPEGLEMLDLLVAANMGIWWSIG